MRFSQAPLQHLQADLGRLVAHADRAHLGQADFVICHLKKGRGFNLKEKKVGGLYVGHLREARGGGDFLSDFSLPGAPCTQASPARGLGDPTLAQCSSSLDRTQHPHLRHVFQGNKEPAGTETLQAQALAGPGGSSRAGWELECLDPRLVPWETCVKHRPRLQGRRL